MKSIALQLSTCSASIEVDGTAGFVVISCLLLLSPSRFLGANVRGVKLADAETDANFEAKNKSYYKKVEGSQ